ncbi:hypothetical protein [Brevibacillus borstelensis]|uniref:hypothetical protein n=1 Tax=Brevibacillus borstelensis TaxID=45462 RepID=UPI00287F94F7|nr:hypothetical protein [Brevibacillus borstelensis]WNF07464.1 hypothetical protein RFB14_08700 [Brevibacillus borstelensis]
MEKITYCRFCNEEHIVSETMDAHDNVVGLFCNREKAMITAHTTNWNGIDVYPAIEGYANRHVDKVALKRIKPDKVNGLARKMAYLFLQTEFAKEHDINYYFAQHHMLDVIRRMKARQAHVKAGE